MSARAKMNQWQSPTTGQQNRPAPCKYHKFGKYMRVASSERQTPRWELGGGFGAHASLQAGFAEQIDSQQLIGAPLRPGPAAEKDAPQRPGLSPKPRPLGEGVASCACPGAWVQVTTRTGAPWERWLCPARPAPWGLCPGSAPSTPEGRSSVPEGGPGPCRGIRQARSGLGGSGCAPRARCGSGAGTIVSVLHTQASAVTRWQPAAALLPSQGGHWRRPRRCGHASWPLGWEGAHTGAPEAAPSEPSSWWHRQEPGSRGDVGRLQPVSL